MSPEMQADIIKKMDKKTGGELAPVGLLSWIWKPLGAHRMTDKFNLHARECKARDL